MDHDVSSLMLGILLGRVREDFGRERNARRALLLDRVMEGRPTVSQSRFLQLPSEILTDIADLLADDKPALASLALVNSDCRQLARSSQFAEVCFNYSPWSQDLVRKLASELSDRIHDRPRPSISVCVRRFTMASNADWLAEYNRQLYDSIWGDAHSSFSQEERNKLRDKGNKDYISLRNIILGVVGCGLPNLEAISWYDSFAVDDVFFRSIAHSPAQHVKLHRLPVDKSAAFGFIKEFAPPATWPLRTLVIDARLAFQPPARDGASALDKRARVDGDCSLAAEAVLPRFFETLLRLCAPTLESLTWNHLHFRDGGGLDRLSFGDKPISFPRLEYLHLQWADLSQPTFMSFLRAPLRHLTTPLYDTYKLGEVLDSCEPIRDLETLVIPNFCMSKEGAAHIARFIEKHDHIAKLYVSEQMEATGDKAHIDSYIVPLLSKEQFTNLRSLSLAWGGGCMKEETRPHVVYVPETSLSVIGKIAMLEQLSLCAGISVSWRSQWLVDHEQLRECFRELKSLKKLALSRDTYAFGQRGSDVEAYYSDKEVGEGEKAAAVVRPELDDVVVGLSRLALDARQDAEIFNAEEAAQLDAVWERAHRNRMLAEAESYAAVLPSLEWIYLGQRPMTVVVQQKDDPRGSGPKKWAVPSTQHRDECYTFLKQTFAMGTGD
ncbi:hypothetical protein AAE478_006349 [Parahypoxylon ruwenzoriense]